MSILLAKNLREILKTWRIWVLIFVMAIAAISGPMFAKYAGKLLSAFGGDLMLGSLPEATAMTASQQWVSDLGQSVTIAIALIAGTMMAGELSDESYFFTLTRGVSRRAFVLSKLYALHGVLLIVLVVFASINAFVTYLLFHDANLAGLCKASALWFIFASFIMVGVAVLAVATSSAVGAGAFGIGLMIVMGVLGLWESVAKFSPAGVHNLAVVMATKQSPESWLSLPITIALIVVLTAVAVGIFSKRDL